MSEENTSVQEPEVSESTNQEIDYKAEYEKTQKLIEDQGNMIRGLDKKVTQLQKEKEEKEKIISEKDEVKKTVEQQIQELQQELQKRDQAEKQKAKESLVNRVIAETKLDPNFDFDFLYKFETEEMIKEKAQERAEYYTKLKEDGFKERAQGTVPKKGISVGTDLSTLSLDELNKLAIEHPEKEAEIQKAIVKKLRS
jgi:hypothetical protein